MTVTILDGKQLKNVAKRLWPLRCKPGKVVGGKIKVPTGPGSGVEIDPDFIQKHRPITT